MLQMSCANFAVFSGLRTILANVLQSLGGFALGGFARSFAPATMLELAGDKIPSSIWQPLVLIAPSIELELVLMLLLFFNPPLELMLLLLAPAS